MLKVLVAVVNFGHGNRAFLEQVLKEFRAARKHFEIHLAVLSNIPKNLSDDVEVVVGLPTQNPRSLPFASRPLFRQRLEEFDHFVYIEDDTLMTANVLANALAADATLQADELVGFIRTEEAPDGSLYYSSSHSFFRWIPDSACIRGESLWAQFSNDHAACYVVSREKLRRAIDSGGFPNEPHDERYGMLESAATDIYTRCGLKRLVCVDKLDDFTLPHLPNKYIGKLGLPKPEMEWQISAVRKIFNGELPNTSLLQPESKLPDGLGSKHCHEPHDETLARLIPKEKQRLLCLCSGDGIAEAKLAEMGHDVTVRPLDSILGWCCQQRKLKVDYFDRDEHSLAQNQFDGLILRDVLQLLNNPVAELFRLRAALKPGAFIVVRVPNLNNLRNLRKRKFNERFRSDWSFASSGVRTLTPIKLARMFSSAGLCSASVRGRPSQTGLKKVLDSSLLNYPFSEFIYLLAFKQRETAH